MFVRLLKGAFLAISFFGSAGLLPAPQVPAHDFAIRNDGATRISFEYRKDDEWKPVTLEAGKDTTLSGDRVRVATTREDGATITVEMPVEVRKKYRLTWNAGSRMWDLGRVS
jgi:hypothetical protein